MFFPWNSLTYGTVWRVWYLDVWYGPRRRTRFGEIPILLDTDDHCLELFVESPDGKFGPKKEISRDRPKRIVLHRRSVFYCATSYAPHTPNYYLSVLAPNYYGIIRPHAESSYIRRGVVCASNFLRLTVVHAIDIQRPDKFKINFVCKFHVQ